MIKVAICQIGSIGTPEENQDKMEKIFLEAVNGSSELDLVVFPEYSYYSPLNREEAINVAIDLSEPHPFVEKMKNLAKEYKVNLIPGSFAEKVSENKICNVVLTINRDGEIIGKYRKIHLFDAASYKESSYVEPGDEICIVDTDFGKIGVMVCYDLRFPELARTMCIEGAEIIVCPSEFPVGQPLPPRVDDWDILVKSTALTNLTYLITANQYGAIHNDTPFGRSCIVDPRGIITSMAQGRECIVYGDIDLKYQESVKDNLAVWENRRPEIYTISK